MGTLTINGFESLGRLHTFQFLRSNLPEEIRELGKYYFFSCSKFLEDNNNNFDLLDDEIARLRNIHANIIIEGFVAWLSVKKTHPKIDKNNSIRHASRHVLIGYNGYCLEKDALIRFFLKGNNQVLIEDLRRHYKIEFGRPLYEPGDFSKIFDASRSFPGDIAKVLYADIKEIHESECKTKTT